MKITTVKLNRRKISIILAFAIVLVLALLAGDQFFGKSKDVGDYLIFFENVTPNYNGRFEPIFVWFTLLVQSLNFDFGTYIAIIVFSSLFVKIAILQKFAHFWFTFLIYLLILFPLHELTQYRVSLALGLLYLSFYITASRGQSALTWIIFAIAVFTHYSAAAFLPILLGWNYFKNLTMLKWPLIVVGIILLIVLRGLIFYYGVEINPTLVNTEVGSLNIFTSRNIIGFLLLIIGVFNWRRIPRDFKPFWVISLYGFILFFIFIDIPVFGARFWEMTFFSYLIWVSFLKGINWRAAQLLLLTLASYLSYKNIYVDPLLM